MLNNKSVLSIAKKLDAPLKHLAETIKELVSFIVKGVDLLNHTSVFLSRTINHCVFLISNKQ